MPTVKRLRELGYSVAFNNSTAECEGTTTVTHTVPFSAWECHRSLEEVTLAALLGRQIMLRACSVTVPGFFTEDQDLPFCFAGEEEVNEIIGIYKASEEAYYKMSALQDEVNKLSLKAELLLFSLRTKT